MVEDAWSPCWNQMGVEVALAAALKLVVGVKGKIPVSEEEETLLLKVLQSAEARQPKTAAVAVSQVVLPFAKVRPPLKVVVAAA